MMIIMASAPRKPHPCSLRPYRVFTPTFACRNRQSASGTRTLSMCLSISMEAAERTTAARIQIHRITVGFSSEYMLADLAEL